MCDLDYPISIPDSRWGPKLKYFDKKIYNPNDLIKWTSVRMQNCYIHVCSDPKRRDFFFKIMKDFEFIQYNANTIQIESFERLWIQTWIDLFDLNDVLLIPGIFYEGWRGPFDKANYPTTNTSEYSIKWYYCKNTWYNKLLIRLLCFGYDHDDYIAPRHYWRFSPRIEMLEYCKKVNKVWEEVFSVEPCVINSDWDFDGRPRENCVFYEDILATSRFGYNGNDVEI